MWHMEQRRGRTKIGRLVREQLEQAEQEWTKAWTESVLGMGRRGEARGTERVELI